VIESGSPSTVGLNNMGGGNGPLSQARIVAKPKRKRAPADSWGAQATQCAAIRPSQAAAVHNGPLTLARGGRSYRLTRIGSNPPSRFQPTEIAASYSCLRGPRALPGEFWRSREARQWSATSATLTTLARPMQKRTRQPARKRKGILKGTS
jgi:hypothetical protein